MSLVNTSMLQALVLAGQILAATAAQPSAYESPALREIVERAARHNRTVPRDLTGYRAHGESELSVLLRGADGEDVAVSIEQAQNDVSWERGGAFTQHVTAYRARSAGPSISALAVLRKPWTIPILYGNRLSLFFGQDSASGPLRDSDGAIAATSSRATLAVHPFATRRDEVYTFAGGDTVAVLHSGERAITLVRILVEPRQDQKEAPVVAFRGEIHLDAELHQIVRMRGEFVTLGHRGPQRQRLLVLPVSVSALVDLESVLIAGRYWLPRYQRIERHVSIRGLAEGNTVFRIVSRFGDHRVTEADPDELPSVDPMTFMMGAMGSFETDPGLARSLTVSSDAQSAEPRAWVLPLGEATARLHGDDFADVLADSAAAARLVWRVQRPADLVHFNRIEGWMTGAGAEVAAGDWAPRLRFRVNAGWAWTEQTLRGRAEALYGTPGRWTAGARFGRTLDITNDFTAPHDSGGSLLAALAGRDDYDYVDRRSATLWLNVPLIPRRALLRLEAGAAYDGAARARLTRGLWATGEPFAANRGVDEGTYARASLTADWNPAVLASPLASGLGARGHYETTAGDIGWQRSTLRVLGRRDVGDRFRLAALVDAGAVSGTNVPPQQLLEVGGEGSLPGFEYKEFAGDRALVARGRVLYRLPLLRTPLNVFGCRCLTAPAPALVATLHGARLVAGQGTMTSMARLGPGTNGAPLSRPTNGWRGSAELGVRFFGGALTIGAARILESRGTWRPSVSIGQQW